MLAWSCLRFNLSWLAAVQPTPQTKLILHGINTSKQCAIGIGLLAICESKPQKSQRQDKSSISLRSYCWGLHSVCGGDSASLREVVGLVAKCVLLVAVYRAAIRLRQGQAACVPFPGGVPCAVAAFYRAAKG
jgi:hypothetical protein